MVDIRNRLSVRNGSLRYSHFGIIHIFLPLQTNGCYSVCPSTRHLYISTYPLARSTEAALQKLLIYTGTPKIAKTFHTDPHDAASTTRNDGMVRQLLSDAVHLTHFLQHPFDCNYNACEWFASRVTSAIR